MASKYFLPDNYQARLNNSHDDERKHLDQYQREVYLYANNLMKRFKFKSVVDIGCGSGYKLIHYLGEYQTLGVETEPCFSYLKELYPSRDWRLSGQSETSFPSTQLCADLVLCVDVIEHIRDPEDLIGYLLLLDFKYCIISTPDRHVLANHPRFKQRYAQARLGPPINKTHVREWGYDEFVCFLSQFFSIIESCHGWDQIECQYHLCAKKHV